MSGNSNKNCTMYIWDEKDGFVKTTKEELKAKLDKGDLYYNRYSEYGGAETEFEREVESDDKSDERYNAFLRNLQINTELNVEAQEQISRDMREIDSEENHEIH